MDLGRPELIYISVADPRVHKQEEEVHKESSGCVDYGPGSSVALGI